MEPIVSFAFAGLFSMTLLSLTFSFQLGIKLRQMTGKLDVMEEQVSKGREADEKIIDEIDEIIKVVDSKIIPILKKSAPKT